MLDQAMLDQGNIGLTLAACMGGGILTLLAFGVRSMEVLNLGVVGYLYFLVRIFRKVDLGQIDVCPNGTVFNTICWEAHTDCETAGCEAFWSLEEMP